MRWKSKSVSSGRKDLLGKISEYFIPEAMSGVSWDTFGPGKSDLPVMRKMASSDSDRLLS